MKRLMVPRSVWTGLLVLCLLFWATAAQALLVVNEGDVYTFQFDNLSFVHPTDQRNGALYWINLSAADPLGTEDQLRITLFEDSGSDVIDDYVWTQIHSWPSISFGTAIIPDVLQDLQGMVRLEMVMGSVLLEEVRLNVAKDGCVYWQSFYPSQTSPVPEPATLLLVGGGLAGLAALRRKQG